MRYINQDKGNVMESVENEEGKIINAFQDGGYVILFPNGTKKEVFESKATITYIKNGDIKLHFADDKIFYYFTL